MVVFIRIIALLLACLLPACANAPAFAQETKSPASITVLNYVSGWQLDSGGYHPALFMLVENTSGKDLSGLLIRFQARFVDLETAEVTIGRTEVRRDLKAHQQFPLSIASDAGFDLPQSIDMWPRIEAKLMCRVGDVGDEGTETLLITKIDEVARSADAAFEHLNEATSYAPQRATAASGGTARRTIMPAPQPPMLAKAAKLDEHYDPARQRPDSKPFLLSDAALPGLGDNFYKFEQRFGLPKEYDVTHSEWTWARYEDAASGGQIIAGSHDRHDDADVVIIELPKASGMDVMRAIACARRLSGKLHSESLSAANKSVRYLPSGRIEIVSCNASGYRAICTQSPGDSENSLILVLARSPQDPEQLLATQAPKVELLKTVRFFAPHSTAEHK